MAKKAKGNRVQVILECTEHKASGMPGTSRYITTKNRKNTTERLELRYWIATASDALSIRDSGNEGCSIYVSISVGILCTIVKYREMYCFCC